ncbi:hypothetical protein [Metapseudomonas resinovorans]|uniref:Integrase n=1 Tax=Metapseudomonas resinovorans NBRC 106553 TaxID=1245471 RepID=S6AVT7_METRE|nr:hypothetical protein [Pseudomonas resinovorans]BAN48596.1 hypothetical protein PCA10_28640 [Pseudomonas resinovorans NBRC 106553]
MSKSPQPLFESLARFNELNFQTLGLSAELPVVRDFLEGFPAVCRAIEGYVVVRSFLRVHSGNQATFASYRTHVERLLLWSLLVAHKPLLDLQSYDAKDYVEFYLNPTQDWVGPVVKSRFLRIGGRARRATDTYILNVKWRPFNVTRPTREPTGAAQLTTPLPCPPYLKSLADVAHSIAVCGSFFRYAISEGLTEIDPFIAVKDNPSYKQHQTTNVAARSLSKVQWLYVIETAEAMASEDVRHERTLFLVATIFALYLKVSDLAGHGPHSPTMGDIRCDAAGSWWFYPQNTGGTKGRISLRGEYVQNYLVRYRRHLQLPPLPSDDEKTPLISTLKGRAGLSDRHIRLLLQDVFDRALARMQEEGWNDQEIDHLRSASLQWLRYTSATFDAPHREPTDLQADLRLQPLTSYSASSDQRRALSIKGLRLKE